MAQQVTAETYIHELMDIDPGNAAILMASGMHCIGCPSSANETLGQACMVHGINVDEIVDVINSYLLKKEVK